MKTDNNNVPKDKENIELDIKIDTIEQKQQPKQKTKSLPVYYECDINYTTFAIDDYSEVVL